ncbi:methionine-S-sulfoxide reductase [Oceaniovalibus guishaninsula JLT2003]|uniref:Peptide methionine sulfoxide reductase MsrA n=1 Tax=Oceaniovalibus guishaninsula JLT2003 TaxID=1231392 RepID=K2I6R8_9RHOB|nr:peptide-methionine (S)-S-oxide reductase MsrA [Oceaniovalibus guishaninsula]EKE44660.1 methionine-S-sulfoxide reductase [Oceaniovalibus guishaninsula JLT2003]
MNTTSIRPLLAGMALITAAAAQTAQAQSTETALVAGGCFWCVEADFEKVEGVKEVVSGFAGGSVANPTYEQVVRGGTGHYEVAEIEYDPSVIDYRQIVNLFFRSIDPTDAGGQFCDRGDSYRTAIFALNDEQQRIAEQEKRQAQQALGQTIVTPVLGAAEFYPADDYHQDYYKSDDRIAFSSVGLGVPKSVAYDRYRDRCGRDQRVRQLWGDAAPFTG